MFGMIRGCCVAFDKPDPLLFIQVYKLLTFYSLVKPPKGSNVEGLEVFETLLNEKDTAVNENIKQMSETLNKIIERGENNNEQYSVKRVHDYNVVSVNQFVQAYFSGFLCKKVETWTNCINCLSTITKTEGNLERDGMINKLTKGYLKYPSEKMFNLLSKLDLAILQTVGEELLNYYTYNTYNIRIMKQEKKKRN